MKYEQAFSLIEVLVYLAISTMLFLFVFDFLSKTQSGVEKVNKNAETNVRAILAIDLLRRDFMCAGMRLADWDLKNKVFRKSILLNNSEIETKDICWHIKNKKLIRIEGVYNYVLQTWKKKIQSVAAYKAKEFDVEVNIDKTFNVVSSVNLNYKDLEVEKFYQVIKLRNRFL